MNTRIIATAAEDGSQFNTQAAGHAPAASDTPHDQAAAIIAAEAHERDDGDGSPPDRGDAITNIISDQD